MFISLTYLYLVYACWRNILRNQNGFRIESIGWYFLFGFNVSAILFFVIKGLPIFIDGVMPSLKAFIIAVLFFGFLLLNRVEILGNMIIDALILSLFLVCIASVLPLGVLEFIHGFENFNDLMINWVILSLAVAILSRVFAWLIGRR